MILKLQGKTAIVTGAGMGIGRGIALELAENGANVIINDINEKPLMDTAQLLKQFSHSKFLTHVGDISNKNVVDHMFDLAMNQFGFIDIVINNASWTTCSKHFMEYDEEFWDSIVKNNLKSVYLVSHKAATIMALKEEGVIINLSSIGATKAHREMVGYDACKGAIEAFTRATALDLAPWNIRVNAISPAVIVGSAVKEMDENILKEKKLTDFTAPLLRQGAPKDIASAAIFLASNESSFMTGQVIVVDGGLSIQARPYSHDKYPTVSPSSFRASLSNDGEIE